MAYKKQNFVPGEKLKASHLNHMEDGIAAAHQQMGVDGSYIFTGVYELREDGRYLVFTEDNFSWHTLVDAVHDSKYVGCVLYDDNRDYPICFSLGGAWFDDGYVVFNAIHKDGWVYELRVFDGGSAILQRYNTRNYIITGTYTLDDNGKIDSVTLDDSFDYDEMVEAIKAGRYVAVRLVDDIDRFYHEVFNLNYWSAEENYVTFTKTSSHTIIELDICVDDGNYQVHLLEREISGGGGTAIDLLWENPDLGTGNIDNRGWFNVKLPNLDDYDQVEIHHITDDGQYASDRFDVDTLYGWAGELSVNYDGGYIRNCRLEAVDGVPTLGFDCDDDYGCVPVRIYGIKNGHAQSSGSGGGGESAYIVTGTWDNADGEYVATIDNFNWSDLKNAINNHRRVSCRLTHEREQSWADYHLVSYSTSDWDEYHVGEESGTAYFERLEEDGYAMRLWIYSDGSTELRSRGRFVTSESANEMHSNLTKTDLLWVNYNAIDNDTDGLNEFLPQSVDVVTRKYDAFEVVFLSGSEAEVSAKVHRGASYASASYMQFTQDGIDEYARLVSVNWVLGTISFQDCKVTGISFGGQGGGSATKNNRLVPYRIYGIKGIDTSEVNSSFHIPNWGSYNFIYGMTWEEWCNSKYNTLGLYINENDVLYHDESDSTLGKSNGDYINPYDLIQVGYYDLL